MARARLLSLLATLGLALPVALAACDDGGETPCAPGQSIACVGDNACDGHQVCKADGSGYDTCECGGGTTSSSSVGSTSTTTSTGMGTGGAGGAPTTTSTTTGASSSSGGLPCTMVYQGSFTIQDLSDIAVIAPYCEITGDLLVAATNVTTLQLPLLEKIGGSFRNNASMGLDTLDLPLLKSAAYLDVSHWPAFHVLNLPKLESAEMLYLSGALATVHLESFASGRLLLGQGSADVDLPELTTGSVSVITTGDFSAAKLTQDLPKCTDAACPTKDDGGLVIRAATISLPLLASAFSVNAWATASSVSLPSLTSIGTDPVKSGLTVLSDTGAIDVPLLASAPNVRVWASTMATLPNLVTVSQKASFEGGGVSAPKLDHIGVELQTSNSLGSLSVPVLKTIGGAAALGQINVVSSTFTTLSFPSLQSFGALLIGYPGGSIGSNPNLVQLSFPALTSFAQHGPFLVGTAQVLPKCRIDALAAKMHMVGWAANESPQLYTTQPTSPCP